MAINSFESRLMGGHPNSLGNTVEVVEEILKDKNKLQDLYDCYSSDDEVVRLRVSSAMKRVCKEKPEWVAEYLDGLINNISKINQPSTKWTLAILFKMLDKYMSIQQRSNAIEIMKNNLKNDDDWIVQNTTSEVLAYFANEDQLLRKWLIPVLKNIKKSKHKSVARRAEKLLLNFDNMDSVT